MLCTYLLCRNCQNNFVPRSVTIQTLKVFLQTRFGLLPYRKPIHVVVGKPIEVKRIENPTREEIENTHATYVKELQKLYEKYNPIYGDKSVKLVIE